MYGRFTNQHESLHLLSSSADFDIDADVRITLGRTWSLNLWLEDAYACMFIPLVLGFLCSDCSTVGNTCWVMIEIRAIKVVKVSDIGG